MHRAPAKEKHDRQTDGWMMDKVIPMWRFAGAAKMVLLQIHDCNKQQFTVKLMQFSP